MGFVIQIVRLAGPRLSHRPGRRTGYRADVFTTADPTGLSSPLSQLVVAAGLVASLVVLFRWWRSQRKR